MTKMREILVCYVSENVILREMLYFQETGKKERIRREGGWKEGKVMGQIRVHFTSILLAPELTQAL